MNTIHRRTFVAGTAGLVAGTLIKPVWANANDTVNVAVMGIRSRGSALASGFAKLPNVNVATICDIDENLLPEAVANVEKACGKRAKTETDIRRVLDNKDIDAIVVAAPNHWHALATIWGCQAGKDVYVEKPVSWSISEGRRMIEAARKHNRIVQTGTQNRSRPVIQAAVEFLHSGKLGKIQEIRCLVFRPRETIGRGKPGTLPKGVNYELWTGPAAMRPYQENRFHYNWHWFWDTGNGETGNNGPHYTDIARWILKKYEHPVRAQSMGNMEIPDSDQETPSTQISTLEYADKTRLQIEVRNWYTNAEDGLRMGLLVYGSEGWMNLGTDDWATYFGRKNEPGPKLTEKEADAKVETFNAQGTGEAPHLQNFINCVRSRKRAELKAEVEEGHYSTALCHLANIAYRTGRTVNFDSKQERFIGDQEANALLTRASYRAPFVVPTRSKTMSEQTNILNRREFIAAGAATLAACSTNAITQPRKLRMAIVGTGSRGSFTWGQGVVQNYSDVVDLVGLCDHNGKRVVAAQKLIGTNAPTFTDFDRMIRETKPETVLVTTVDGTHAKYIIRAMELGCDVMSEKPLCTDEQQCQAIVDAQKKYGKKIDVTFNARHGVKDKKLKELLMQKAIGEVISVDFHEYLDTSHGADYFRRWHRMKANSGTLLVHKASHHFDQANWWLNSSPMSVTAFGELKFYGRNSAIRGTNCRSCAHKQNCKFYWDITKNASHVRLYTDCESEDGYLRDGCVFNPTTDIYDTMSVVVRYENGVTLNYTANTFLPYEGQAISFNGTKGRLDLQQFSGGGFKTDELRLTRSFGKSEVITDFEKPREGGHGGADSSLHDLIFRGLPKDDPLGLRADWRDGAKSSLIGIAARRSIERGGQMVKINDLVKL